MLPKVAIVGRPNVGKSSLFNRIVGKRLSITDDKPGVTRDRIYEKASWLLKEFYLIDTGGIEIKDAPFSKQIRAQVEVATDEADVIIFVVDVRASLTDDDNYIAKMLYKTKKPVIVAVNKVDDNSLKDNMYDFYALGFDLVMPVSTLHGIGVGDMLDEVVKLFNNVETDEEDKVVKFSVVGRPNVGKSSLVNALLGEKRVIVSDISGTTRDAIDTKFTYNDKEYMVVDTAGLKKRGKIYENIDRYATIRTVDAIIRSDIVLLVLDASVGIIEQDTHIGEYIEQYNKPCVIVYNKWDLVKKDSNTMQNMIKKTRETFKYLDYAPIVFISVLTDKRLETIFPEIDLVSEAYDRRIQTATLNNVISDAVAMFPPSKFNGGIIKIYYTMQAGTKPPTFQFFVNDESFLHFSYKRYLENQLRKNFDFYGTPIKLEFKKRD